jgi:hypothetical protein
MVAVAISQNFAIGQAIAEALQHLDRRVNGRKKLRYLGPAMTRAGSWQRVGGTWLVPFNIFT